VLPEIGDLVKLAGDPNGLIGIIIKQTLLGDLNPDQSGPMYTVLWSGVNSTTDLWARDIRLVSKS